MNRHTPAVDWPLILLVVLVGINLLVQSVVKETRLEVWELGKGYRAATAEERAYAREREERR